MTMVFQLNEPDFVQGRMILVGIVQTQEPKLHTYIANGGQTLWDLPNRATIYFVETHPDERNSFGGWLNICNIADNKTKAKC